MLLVQLLSSGSQVRCSQPCLTQSTYPGVAEKTPFASYSTHIIKIIQEFGFDALRAPYSQSPQLAYFVQPSTKTPGTSAAPIVHAVFGPNDLFLYGVTKVITNIDFEVQS